jgi:hypothetical protein
MRNGIMIDATPMQYHIGYERSAAMDKLKRADFMSIFSPKVKSVIEELAAIINATHPLQVPMVWSIYPERIWESAVPCLEINPRYIDPYVNEVKYCQDHHSSIDTILGANVTLTINCAPCWETYKRWGTVILGDFYKAMRAVRAHYGFNLWDDNSEPSVKWGNPRYIYTSPAKRPLVTLAVPLPDTVERYGIKYNQQLLNVKVSFHFEMPATPESELNSANCHVVEEEVQVTVTRKVKTLKCA